MKKLYLIVIALVLANGVFAQIDFGIKAGLNRTSLNYSGSELNDIGTKSDFNAGVYILLPLFSKFYLQSEMVYSGQGSRYTDSIPEKINYDYLNIPILFKYQHQSGFFAETGPQFGFLVNASFVENGNTVNVKSNTQSFDFSWAFGLGYKIPKINLGLDLRYNLGLTSTSPSDYNTSGAAKNSVFQLDLFYQFRFH